MVASLHGSLVFLGFLLAVTLPLPATAGDDEDAALYRMVLDGKLKGSEELLRGGARADKVRGDYGETALIQAAGMGHTSLVRSLLQYGADPDARDRQGFPPLLRALRSGQTVAALELIKHKTVDLGAVDHGGNTALHRACQSPSDRHCVRQLIQEKVPLEPRNLQGWTPLHACARYGRMYGATYLLDAGVGIDVTDAEGYTPLHRAAMLGHQKIVEKLVASGARTDLRAVDGNTALDIAKLLLQEATAAWLEANSQPGGDAKKEEL